MSHIHEKIDFTASALIVHDNKVLLRLHDKYNIWLGIGGHIELDEDPYEALLREVKEESGLEIEVIGKKQLSSSKESVDLPVPAFLNRHHTSPGHDHIDMLYVCRAKTLNINPAPDEKKTEFKWFTGEELQNLSYEINPHTRYYAAEAIRLAAEVPNT